VCGINEPGQLAVREQAVANGILPSLTTGTDMRHLLISALINQSPAELHRISGEHKGYFVNDGGGLEPVQRVGYEGSANQLRERLVHTAHARAASCGDNDGADS
jgi:hypothetical protein